jgi:glycosyltransferase involved in cell wall biosynthesis
MTNPIVSIVIPTYNHAHFLRSALDSVIAQSIEDWEVIVVNNYSNDDTTEVVESYKDPRIQLVNFANNGIIASARNYGLSLAKGSFIAFLDSDDFWYPEKLAHCLQMLNAGYDLICHAEVWSGPGSHRRVVEYGPKKMASYEHLLFDGNCLSTSAVVLRRTLLDRSGLFNESHIMVTAEDYDLWLKLARDGTHIGFLTKVLGEYRIHGENQSHAALRNMKAEMEVFQEHCRTFNGSVSISRKKRREAIILYSGARSLQDNKQFTQAWLYFYKAIICYPWVLRFYLAMVLNLFRCSPRLVN